MKVIEQMADRNLLEIGAWHTRPVTSAPRELLSRPSEGDLRRWSGLRSGSAYLGVIVIRHSRNSRSGTSGTESVRVRRAVTSALRPACRRRTGRGRDDTERDEVVEHAEAPSRREGRDEGPDHGRDAVHAAAQPCICPARLRVHPPGGRSTPRPRAGATFAHLRTRDREHGLGAVARPRRDDRFRTRFPAVPTRFPRDCRGVPDAPRPPQNPC
jgi:hypothetical protein